MEIVLDKSQKKAVEYDRGNLLVIAGPGAGKTRVIIGRMQHLIANGVLPDRILAVTFTNKAADEIRDRITQTFSDIKSEPLVSTFHSLALKILREFHDTAGLTKHFTVIDETAQDEILRRSLKNHSITPSTPVLRRLRSHLDYEKAHVSFPLKHPNVKKEIEEEISEVFREYQSFLMKHNAVDFNDLILLALMVLQSDDEARMKFRNRFDHILLDEFQDINLSQYIMTRLIVRDDASVLAVADSDQMIYNWRGSDPKLINTFLHDFNAEMLELSQNYRSADEINLATKGLISHNKPKGERKFKIPENIEPRIALVEISPEINPAQGIVKIIKLNISRGYQPGDIAIVYRMHGIGDDIERELSGENIPVIRVRPSDDFIREGIDQLMSYLKLSQNLFDWDVKSAWDFPRRILNPLEGLRVSEMARSMGVSLFKLIGSSQSSIPVSPLAMNRLRRFSKLVEELSILGVELSPSGYFARLRKKLGTFFSPFNPNDETKLIQHLSWTKDDWERLFDCLMNQSSKPHVLILHSGGTMLQLASLMISRTLRIYPGLSSQIALSNRISENTWKSLSGRINQDTPLVILHLGSADKTGGFLEEFWKRGFAFEIFEIKPPLHGEMFQIPLTCYRMLIDLVTRMPENADERIVIYDLETTGIDTRKCEIIEISALKTTLYGEESEVYNTLVKPNSPPPPEVQELTGITPDMLQSGIQPNRAISEFHAFSRDAFLTGHNILDFDNQIMERYFPKVLGVDFIPECIDTVRWARELFPGQNNSLAALGERFSLATEGLHRAGEDVRLNREIFYKLLETDGIKRGLDFLPEAVLYMALIALERDEPEKDAGAQFISGAIRLLANENIDLNSMDKDIKNAFSEIASKELLERIELLKKEPYPLDPQRERWDALADYIAGLILHYEERSSENDIGGFLNHYSLLNESDLLQEGNAVRMMTIHAAKGLEFPIVIIDGLEQGAIPHYLALENLERIEEERRLLYVAMTRAREKIYLIYSPKRGGRYRPPSMFTQEIPKELFKKYRIQ